MPEKKHRYPKRAYYKMGTMIWNEEKTLISMDNALFELSPKGYPGWKIAFLVVLNFLGPLGL